MAVSIFSIFFTSCSISFLLFVSRSAILAPVLAAFPAELTSSRSQSGIRPKTIAYFTSIWLPKAPANLILSIFLIANLSINNFAPAYNAALASCIARISFCVTIIFCSPS